MRIERRTWPRWVVRIVGLLAAWAFLLVVIILEMEWTPKTTVGWMLLVVVGPPVYVGLEWAVDHQSKVRMGRLSVARFSFTQVAVALVAMLVILFLLAL